MVAVVLMPYVKNRFMKPVFYFLLGIGVPVCLYCAWFFSNPWDGVIKGLIVYLVADILLGIFFGLSWFAYIPFYLLYHIYRYFLQANKLCKVVLISGIIIPFVMLTVYLKAFRQHYVLFERACQTAKTDDEFLKQLPANYFIERLLGIGFKYHTALDYWDDGWRPPIHDPFLNIGLWVFANSYYPYRVLDRRYYYKRLFPNEPLKADCPCSYMNDGRTYLNPDWDQYLPHERFGR